MKERGSVVFEKKRLEGDTTEIKNGYKTKNKRAQKGFQGWVGLFVGGLEGEFGQKVGKS